MFFGVFSTLHRTPFYGSTWVLPLSALRRGPLSRFIAHLQVKHSLGGRVICLAPSPCRSRPIVNWRLKYISFFSIILPVNL